MINKIIFIILFFSEKNIINNYKYFELINLIIVMEILKSSFYIFYKLYSLFLYLF